MNEDGSLWVSELVISFFPICIVLSSPSQLVMLLLQPNDHSTWAGWTAEEQPSDGPLFLQRVPSKNNDYTSTPQFYPENRGSKCNVGNASLNLVLLHRKERLQHFLAGSEAAEQQYFHLTHSEMLHQVTCGLKKKHFISITQSSMQDLKLPAFQDHGETRPRHGKPFLRPYISDMTTTH